MYIESGEFFCSYMSCETPLAPIFLHRLVREITMLKILGLSLCLYREVLGLSAESFRSINSIDHPVRQSGVDAGIPDEPGRSKYVRDKQCRCNSLVPGISLVGFLHRDSRQ